MGKDLTARQKEVYDFIYESIVSNGLPPTIREIGAKFGMSSTNAVRDVLSAIERKGYIRRRGSISRGIELTTPVATDSVSIPLIGRIAAGAPITAAENIEDSFAVDRSFVPGGDVFSLRVQGDSMIDAGINDGDIVLVQKQNTANKGEIIVAVIGDEATVKRFFPERKRIRLEPENADYGPIVVEKDSPGFYIAGKVIGLMRRM
ncbi:MAG: transcriptional repressor LexA [candidate division Zixibacteria bacterium]|nr:transcriptional repressor LexA [candidate division Zixibacteria bacterium]